MAGLASAARLAKKGHKVRLFEAGDKLGGKCQCENIDGFVFDTGPSLLTLPAVYRDLFIKPDGWMRVLAGFGETEGEALVDALEQVEKIHAIFKDHRQDGGRN